jgi:hypothetical protein
LSNQPNSVAFYLLRVSPGAPQQAQPTRIPITLANTNILGAAVSPDGQTLAVLSQPGGLTWLDDGHTLGFAALALTGAVGHWDIRTLNTTSPGTNLTADSTVGTGR